MRLVIFVGHYGRPRVWKDLREAVRNLDRAGVSQDVAMQRVGRKTDSIYRRYRIVDAQDLRDAAARLDSTQATKVTAKIRP